MVLGKIFYAFFCGTRLPSDVPQEDLLFCKENICAESYLAYLYMLLPRVKVRADLFIPTLVIGGEADRLFTIKEQKTLAKTFKSDLLLLPNIAHDMMLDTNWKMAAKAIQHWLQKPILNEGN